MKTSTGFIMALLLAGLLATRTGSAQTANAMDGIYALYNHAVDQHSFVQPFQIALQHSVAPPPNDQTRLSAQVPNPNWQGCAALAVARNSQQFYLAEKHRAESGLWVQGRTGGLRQMKGENRMLKNTFLAKMATGPDGHIYAISTSLCSVQSPRGKALLIRFRNGHAEPEILGPLVSRDFDPNTLTYSGDMAFSASGDLFIFGTEVDTVLRIYKGAHILRIAGERLRQAAAIKKIPVEYIAFIRGMGTGYGMDSTVVTGVAFDENGQFIIAATDKQTERETYFFKGRIRYRQTQVFALPSPNGIPPGYVASDLASVHFPALTILAAPATSNSVAQEKNADSWEQYVTIRTFQF